MDFKDNTKAGCFPGSLQDQDITNIVVDYVGKMDH